ncbi:ArfGap domain-containing protein [Cephalotus follicularis]|uniref:ArfGap domain-containing protein n=1 Tax=Cephalotus follicularis TaxID=3775 RepID=A0A1Q3D0V5_CEPFO|nr:ArfGap domain-containing protein [Cephalotus follicularis]
MSNRLKEEEKNERIIRGLLKLPDNRRCINCNSLGPQYVCTNFWTFVCTTCGGIHREFTHRVKSVSMAKFTSQEVSALQEGGNQPAKEIYFKEWDPQRQSTPDSSNVERLRDFIRHVYVDRRYTGEKNYDKPPRAKTGEKDEFNENRRTDTYQGGSRSPPYEDAYERRYSERSSPGGRSDDKNSRYSYDERRSPGYEQESRQYGDYRRSPPHPEIVNDWRRDDRFGNGKKFEDRRISEGEAKLDGKSPEQTKDLETSSPPIVRPVREILGENIVPLRISEPPKANGGRTSNVSAHAQRTASSSSLGSTNGTTEIKLETSRSLIDFDAEPEPPLAAAAPQAQQTMAQSVSQTVSSTNENNWASFDLAPESKVSQAPSNTNTLESVLSQLSVPVSAPGHTLGMPHGAGALAPAPLGGMTVLPISGDSPVAPVGHLSMSPFTVGAPAAGPVSSFSTFPPGSAFAAAPVFRPRLPVNGVDARQWPSVQNQQPSLFPATGSQTTVQQFTPLTDGASGSQPRNLSFGLNGQGPLSTPAAQAVSKPAQEAAFFGVSQPHPVDVKSSGRKELPENLFAAHLSFFPAPAPGWQTGPPRGMGAPMQYNTTVLMPTFVQSSKSTNPFDLNTESTQTFPSVASLQHALPNVPTPSGLLRTSSLGTPPAWMPAQSAPYPTAMPSQAPSYGSAVSPRAYMGQPIPGYRPPSGYQGVGGFGSESTSYGSINTDHQFAGRFAAPAAPQPFSSVGGNPFG